MAGSRTLVHEKIYDQFVSRAAAYSKSLKTGDPFASGVFNGP
jgi:acyl-CoA reductase-like NAD-dependent aldehyde dehydrogenase